MDKYLPQLLIKPNFNLIGHRGVPKFRPENTMASFKLAVALGLNWIEFDTMLTKCGHWIVMHDSSIDRTTNGKGLVINKTLAELESLEAGLWFKPPFPGEKIPTLEQVINFSFETNLLLNIEVKIDENSSQQFIEHNAKSFAKFITTYYPHMYAKPLVASFNLEFLKALRKLHQEIPIGYLVEKITPDTIPIVKAYDFTSINCDAETLQATDINLALHNHIPIIVYTVNDKSIAQKLLNLGVLGIITDSPDLLNPAIAEKLGLQENLT